MVNFIFRSKKGLSRKIVEEISEKKNEPGWMTDFRLFALKLFESMPMPTWGCDLSGLDVNDIFYYLKPIDNQKTSWDEVPKKIKLTFERLGLPEAEQKFLAGIGAQYESEIVYKSLRKKWADKGVVFLDISQGLEQYPDVFKKYFASIVPAHDNKFAALNTAVWSGGNFILIPRGLQVDMPLQAYFRIDSSRMGQFERTLIIAEEESYINYVEGCSAPVYKQNSLHSAVVEIIALPRSRIRYTTIQNWSVNVYNLVTKRAIAYQNASIEWVDGNFGSKCTMKYPAIILKETGAKGQIISVAVCNKGQHQDSGGKIIHLASHTSSHITSKSICKDGGRSSYRGSIKVNEGAVNVRARMHCDALLLDEKSRADTYPKIEVKEPLAEVGHEACISKLSDEKLFYLQSRGLSKSMARAFIVNGFLEIFVKELPMEYAVEINRLISMELEN